MANGIGKDLCAMTVSLFNSDDLTVKGFISKVRPGDQGLCTLATFRRLYTIRIGKAESSVPPLAALTKGTSFFCSNGGRENDVRPLLVQPVVLEGLPPAVKLGRRHTDAVVANAEFTIFQRGPMDLNLRCSGIVAVGNELDQRNAGIGNDVTCMVFKEAVAERE